MHSKQSSKHHPFPQVTLDSQCPPIDLCPGQNLHGFEVKAVTPIDELRATAIELAHGKSGARLLHLCTDDTKNWFTISAITPTPDDTGVQHILEHCVAAGSRKYPIKEVLFEMIEMSLATYDSTCALNRVDHVFYFASSSVTRDLFNLAEIFFDSVFHPLLEEATFKREGHRLEPVDPDKPTGDLRINGIVYNEVKSGMTDPRVYLQSTVISGLLPDTCYSRNGAGDPLVMPNLTYEHVRAYHQTYYHPSNSYFVFYGNIPTCDYLEFLVDKLEAMPKTETDGFLHPLRPENTRPPKWKSPRTVSASYPIGADEPLAEKTFLMLSWLVGDSTDLEDAVLCRILSLILFGNQGSALRKAIISSNLGNDLLDDCFLDGLTGPHSTFHIGLMGSEADRVGAYSELVVNTLTEIADADFDAEKVEAALHQLAFEYKEITPRFTIQTIQRVINTWIHEKEPTLLLKTGSCLSSIRQRWEENPRIFNELIRERLLDNPHRLTTILVPDPHMQARLDAEENARLKAIRAQLTDGQLKKIAADAAALERRNEQRNSPEDLAKLPQLSVSDLPEKPLHIPKSVETVCGRPLIRSDVYSNGVNYLVLNFDLQGLPQHLWQYVPRYTDAISKLGTSDMNYEQMAQRTAAATGGLECSPCFSAHALDPGQSVWNIQFRLKALDDKIEDALEVLHDLVFAVNPRDTGRLRDVLHQAAAKYRAILMNRRWYPYGLASATYHAARGISPQAHLSEIVFGFSQLRTCRMLLNSFDESHEELSGCIEQIRDFLLVRGRVAASFTGSDASFESFQRKLAAWIRGMRDEPIVPAPTGFKPDDTPRREGLVAPVQVANCSHAISAPHYSNPDSVLLAIGAHMVAGSYIWNEVRLKGNAYGSFFGYDPIDAFLCQGSYADPHIARTLNVFAQTADYVKRADWTQSDIDRAIIGTAAYCLKTVPPGNAASDALAQHLTGQSQNMIEERYAQPLRATPKEVKRVLLQVLEDNRDKAAVCVVASREKLEAENRKMAHPLSIENIME